MEVSRLILDVLSACGKARARISTVRIERAAYASVVFGVGAPTAGYIPEQKFHGLDAEEV
jgi:hypothetical protein